LGFKRKSVKQISAIISLALLIFIAAIAYLLTRPPANITLKEMLKVNPPSSDAPKSLAEPVKMDSIIADTLKASSDDKVLFDYYVIIESDTNQEFAQQKADKLKGLFKTDFIVLPPTKEGYYRISYGKYSSFEEAKSAIENIKRTIRSEAWIFSIKK
jgi:hypothetical protein